MPASIEWLARNTGFDAAVKRILTAKDTKASLYVCELISLVLSADSPSSLCDSQSDLFGKLMSTARLQIL